MEIDALSNKYESGGNPGAIGFDEGGGWSYGMNQIATKTGTLQSYLNYLQVHYPDLYAPLHAAGGAAAATAGAANFKAAWKSLAATHLDEFKTSQRQFMISSNYNVCIARLQRAQVDLSQRTMALANVIYSMSVMAGPGTAQAGGKGACGLIYDSLVDLGGISKAASIDDGVLIEQIYKDKLQRIDNQKEYRAVSPGIRASVRNRVVREHADAVAMLLAERHKS